jgi:predicted ATP-grasp superfamily ATP-dependent carboligase
VAIVTPAPADITNQEPLCSRDRVGPTPGGRDAPRILVLDGHSSAALAFTRSLGRAKYWVAAAAASDGPAYTGLSRYCRQTWTYPSPLQDSRAFLTALGRFVKEHRIDLVIPATDATTWPIAAGGERLPADVSVAVARNAALELVSDKYRTIKLGSELGIPIPETRLVQVGDGWDAREMTSWGSPIVVKDRYSIRWVEGRGLAGRVAYARDLDELRAIVEQRLARAGDVLVQRFVAGEGIGFSSFAIDGRCRLPFQWRRLREKDPRGSGSSARRSVPVDPEVQEASQRLLVAAGFEGIAMVEYKRDFGTGQVALMEVNGRPWGSLQLAIACGVDYPRHLADWYLTGRLPKDTLAYRSGITCRHLAADLTHLENVWGGRPTGWPLPYPSFARTLIRVSVPWYPGLHCEDFAARDPRPGLAQLGDWLRAHLPRRTRR